VKAAIVKEAGKTPVYGDFVEPDLGKGQVRIAVSVASLSPVVRSRASGTHYSTSGRCPFVVGIDGVGGLDDGRRVYFVMPKAPFGSMAERVVIHPQQCVPVPDDLDDVTAAAIANPGLSSWVALKERAQFVAGETVLVNGATGTAGRLAVQVAKHFGAKKVVATGRNIEALKSTAALGADVTVPLTDDLDSVEKAFRAQFDDGIDVVLDYLWGPSAERLLIAAAKAGKDAVPIRFVQIGSASKSEITLPSAVLRSSALQLMGSGIGGVALDRMVTAIGELLRATTTGRFQIATRTVPLSHVEQVWSVAGNSPRVVFQMDSIQRGVPVS
jgi:NADPH:quinone reductase-like Zn-dependent oxidoreductase